MFVSVRQNHCSHAISNDFCNKIGPKRSLVQPPKDYFGFVGNLTHDVADFVLHPPSREHESAIGDAIARALDIVPLAVEGKMEAAMLKLHSQRTPPL